MDCGAGSGSPVYGSGDWMVAHARTRPAITGPMPGKACKRASKSGSFTTSPSLHAAWASFLARERPTPTMPRRIKGCQGESHPTRPQFAVGDRRGWPHGAAAPAVRHPKATPALDIGARPRATGMDSWLVSQRAGSPLRRPGRVLRARAVVSPHLSQAYLSQKRDCPAPPWVA